jgi:triosephosphate isomerase
MIKIPFFEFGPKAYLWGEEALDLAEYADSLVKEFDVEIIFTPQYTDIPAIARRCKNLHVFAQHMDSIQAGRGQGSVLAEALKAAGARGVQLNHTEKPLSLGGLESAICRAKETGLLSMVCTDNLPQALAAAHFSPDILVVENPALIGGGTRRAEDDQAIPIVAAEIRRICPGVKIIQASGIKGPDDIYRVIRAGSDAAGSSSGIAMAQDKRKMFRDMVEAVRRGFDHRQQRIKRGHY